MCARLRHADQTVSVATSTSTLFARASKATLAHRHNADPSVLLVQNVLQRMRASIKNVSIRVVVHVAEMPAAKCSTTVQFAVVNRVKLGIHSAVANPFQLSIRLPKMKVPAIHVYHRLVVRTHSVVPTPIHHRVNASPATLEHHRIAVPSASSMPIVRHNMLASIANASTRVLAHAAPMPNVTSSAIRCLVYARRHTPETRSYNVSLD